MSRSFKKNAIFNDVWPKARFWSKKKWNKKNRRNEEINYGDMKINAFKEFMNPNKYIDNFYYEFLRK
jgi:hypothetical protein